MAIEPPELEMRVAILIRKALAEGTEMPEDVAFFIAKNVRANVRELEGALRKVLAYSRFNHKDININLARDALKDLLSIQNRQIGVENIQKTVADFYKIKVADMYSKKRPASIARPRQIAMYLAKDMTKKSLPEIGELFGGRDHTTVLHAVRKITAERTDQPRAEPAAARAGANPERVTGRRSREGCGKYRHNLHLSTDAWPRRELSPLAVQRHAVPHAQGSPPHKPLMEKAKIALSPEIAPPYYCYQV